jgi:hypothetical protein
LNVICLVGTSRCGSTILQAALGQFQGVSALGEVKRLTQLAARGAKCGCGADIATCEIWGPRVADFIATDHSRLRMLQNALAIAAGGRLLKAEDRAAESLKRTLQGIHSADPAQVFIDSSKDPDQLLLYASLRDVKVFPIHVVRDPRGVVQSGQRRTGIAISEMARHWRRLNAATLALRWATPRLPWRTVLYENFCANPEKTCNDILQAVGCEARLRSAPVNHHAIGGSPGFAFAGIHTIQAEDKWRTTMPADVQAGILRESGWPARYFKYRQAA